MIRPMIFVFAKPARRGRAKTRLAKGIGDAAALAFQRACLAMTLRKLQRGPWRLVLCVTPDASARDAHLWPMRTARMGQGRGDLGTRMERALMSRRGPAIVVGSDIPDLNAMRLRDAFKKLGDADLVFGKSRDGGYWLVGSRYGALAKGAFENARWSSEYALADTLANVKHRRVAFAATLDDVDDAADYERYLRASERNSGNGGPMFRIDLKDINAVIQTVPDDDLFDLAQAFWKKAAEAGSEFTADWRLLGGLCGMMLKPSDSRHPFHALSQMGSKRSLLPSDLTKDSLDDLTIIVEKIESASLKARLYDVLWVAQKSASAARCAIPIYLELAKQKVDPEKWTTSAEYLERALRLGRSLGATSENIEAASKLLIEFLETYRGLDRLFLSFRCLELAIEFGIGARSLLEEVIQNGCNAGLANKDFYKAEKYYEIAERFFRSTDDKAREREQKIKLAESFILRAEGAEAEANYIVASHFYHESIKAYRRVGGMGSEIEEIKSRLPAVDAKCISQMKPVGTEIDLTEMANHSRAQVSDVPSDRVIYAISWVKELSSFDGIANAVKNNIREAPLSNIMGASIVDKNGRTVAKYDPIDLSKLDLSRDDLWPRASRWMDMERSLFVAGGLMPALSQVLADHSAEEIEILKFIEFSRFVPADRVESFDRGIRAGLLGDWMGVAGLLIPQIEHSVRMLMDVGSLPIDKVNPDGTHEYIELNSMLANEDVQRLLGPDLAFELRSLLTDKFGPNLRNKHAHGLLSDEDYDSHSLKYFWWLVIRAISEFPKEHER